MPKSRRIFFILHSLHKLTVHYIGKNCSEAEIMTYASGEGIIEKNIDHILDGGKETHIGKIQKNCRCALTVLHVLIDKQPVQLQYLIEMRQTQKNGCRSCGRCGCLEDICAAA